MGGVRAACAALGADADDFSQAILTSDAGPKRACLEVEAARRDASAWRPRRRAPG